MARLAFADVVGSGVAADDLVAAALAYAVDPIFKRRDFGPVSLQRWLGEGRYRAWLPSAPPSAEPAAGSRTPFAGPADLRAAIVADPACGEGFARSFLDRAGWDDADRTVAPATGEAAKRLQLAIVHFRAFDVSIGAPASRGKS